MCQAYLLAPFLAIAKTGDVVLWRMAYELYYWPSADDHLTTLERDPGRGEDLAAIERTISWLADDPYNPRLGTTAFRTEQYGGVSATPIRGTEEDDWYVLWQRGAETGQLDIIAIVRLVTGSSG